MAKEADTAKQKTDPTSDSDSPSLRQVLRRAHEEGKLFIFRSEVESRAIHNNKRCIVVGDGTAPLIRIEPDKKKMDPLVRVMNMPHPLQDPMVALPEELLSLEEAKALKHIEDRRRQRKWLFWALGVWAAMLIGMYLIHVNGEMRVACRDQATRSAPTDQPASFWRPCGKRGV